MVNGLDVFKEHFKDYTAQYILIGGAACDLQFAQKEMEFRATKDLDLILVVEALSPQFVKHFWEFIIQGKYTIAQVNSKKCFYRFHKPNTNGYPAMLELFSRKPDTLNYESGYHITDIPAGEDASSLSAILLEDDYYHFVLKNSIVIGDVHIASDFALICLKCKAFLNNSERKENGENVQSEDISKHRKDVLRLTATIGMGPIETPGSVQSDLKSFIEHIQLEEEAIRNILDGLKLKYISVQEIIERLSTVFQLNNSVEQE